MKKVKQKKGISKSRTSTFSKRNANKLKDFLIHIISKELVK